jgi:hypothetical protein
MSSILADTAAARFADVVRPMWALVGTPSVARQTERATRGIADIASDVALGNERVCRVNAQRLVIFDLDGTLFDHPAAAGRAIRVWLGSLGVPEVDLPGLASAWLEVEERHFAAVRSLEVPFEEIRRLRLRDFLPLFGYPVVESDLDDVFAGYLALYEANSVTQARCQGLVPVVGRG